MNKAKVPHEPRTTEVRWGRTPGGRRFPVSMRHKTVMRPGERAIPTKTVVTVTHADFQSPVDPAVFTLAGMALNEDQVVARPGRDPGGYPHWRGGKIDETYKLRDAEEKRSGVGRQGAEGDTPASAPAAYPVGPTGGYLPLVAPCAGVLSLATAVAAFMRRGRGNSSRGAGRSGVGMIELLVVIGVCSLLVALLLPSVQQARSAALRLACQSNLRQVATAVAGYEAATGRLPPSHRHGPAVRHPGLRWPLLISAHLGYDANWRAADEDFAASRDMYLPTPHRGLSVPLKPFACPADSRLATAWTFSLKQVNAPGQLRVTARFALSSYLGNSGTRTAARDGVLFADDAVAMVGVSDGTSSTILAGERPPSANRYFGWLYAGWWVPSPAGDECTGRESSSP